MPRLSRAEELRWKSTLQATKWQVSDPTELLEMFKSALDGEEWGASWLEVVHYFAHQESLMEDSLLAVPVLVEIFEETGSETAFELAAIIEKVRRSEGLPVPRTRSFRGAAQKVRSEVFRRLAEDAPISASDLHRLLVYAASFRDNQGLSWAIERYDADELASGQVAAREELDPGAEPDQWEVIATYKEPQVKNIGLMLDVDGDVAALLGGGRVKKVDRLGVVRDSKFVYRLQNGEVMRCRVES